QALDNEPERKADGRRCRAEEQEKGRAEDEVYLGYADREVRKNLEEREHQPGGDRRSPENRRGARCACGVEGFAKGQSAGSGGGGVAQHDLGTVDDAGFDMHGMSSWNAGMGHRSRRRGGSGSGFMRASSTRAVRQASRAPPRPRSRRRAPGRRIRPRPPASSEE